mmetsp:Transcript_8438/g.25357  ORF Transcript_8438/g.25357 Transcript_8438/m.25357 type:complete len:370 (+) Transcript_8438:2-1111(+)
MAVEETRVYDVASQGSRAPSWKKNSTAKERRKARLKEAKESANSVQVLQDFEMPSVSHRVKCTKDGEFIMVSGTYPPMIKAFEVAELSMKFQRNLDCEIVDFLILDNDWRKLAFLTADRCVELHAQFGTYYKVRVPRFGRDLALNPEDCDLFICGEGPDVFRLNLEQGRFLAPLQTKSGEDGGNNCIGFHPRSHLIGLGGENGLLEIWDPRTSPKVKPAGTLNVGAGITALRFDASDDVTMAIGTSEGQILLYDIRSSKPFVIKEQGYGLPVKSVKMHSGGKHILSCDAKSIKAWEKANSSRNLLAVEPLADVNHLCLVGDSGVILAAAETSKVLSYYVPALGLAPKWSSFLGSGTNHHKSVCACVCVR